MNFIGVVVAFFMLARCDSLLREAVTIIARMVIRAAVRDATNRGLPIELFVIKAVEIITAHRFWIVGAFSPWRNLEINIKMLCAAVFFNATSLAGALLHMILGATVVCVDMMAVLITVVVAVSKEVLVLGVTTFMAVCVIEPHLSVFGAGGF